MSMAQGSAADLPVPEDEEDEDQRQDEAVEDEEAEYNQFRQWMRLRAHERRSERPSRRSREQSRRRADEDDDDQGSDFRTNAGPPPPWDGAEYPFEDYLIRARIWVSTTKAQARTRGPLLLKALSGTPF